MRHGFHRFAERALQAAGVTLLLLVAAALAHRALFSHLALTDFDSARTALLHNGSRINPGTQRDKAVDLSLWSNKRVRAFRNSLRLGLASPLAVLRIDKLGIRVPVFEGTDAVSLNSGVGWISSTAAPGEVGNRNIGIAGHRDGFFRGLGSIRAGDAVELSTLEAVSYYAVDSIEIVNPGNVSVLLPRRQPSLTLVTCYPFHFLGAAPRRFIVHATLTRQVGAKEVTQRRFGVYEPLLRRTTDD